ncbi:hypothetical protein FKP32DRAFT_40815 [Trametes sanguinea]|nr:hypothetical protein FKP32DRAFT_40815 [Trametes sanguinea]
MNLYSSPEPYHTDPGARPGLNPSYGCGGCVGQARQTHRLPTDVTFMVCSYLRHSDLHSLALADKRFNDICTPLIYRNVRLLYGRAVDGCLRTLFADPQTLSFQRDLAALVQDFFLSEHWCIDGKPDRAASKRFQSLLYYSLKRMSNVRAVNCKMLLSGLGIWAALITTPHPALRSLTLGIEFGQAGIRISKKLTNRLAATDLSLPLTKIVLRVEGSPTPEAIPLLRNLLVCCAGSVEQLGVSATSSGPMKIVVHPLSSIPALQELGIRAPQLSEPGLSDMSQIASLTIRDVFHYYDEPSLVAIPATHWPLLETLACSPRL